LGSAGQVPTLERFNLDDMAATAAGPATFRRPSGTLGMYVKTLVFVGLLGGITFGIVYVSSHGLLDHWLGVRRESTSVSVRPIVSDAFNYRFAPASAVWLPDEATQATAKANFVLRRDDPTAWVAVMAKDYKVAAPADRELVDFVLKRLGEYLGDLQHELKEEAVQLAGQKATRVLFAGEAPGVGTVFGEAYVMGQGSIGYAVLTWAPQKTIDLALPEFPEVRKGFSLLNTPR
jgi:hypothetical protein